MKDNPRTPMMVNGANNPDWLRWFADMTTQVSQIRQEDYRAYTEGTTLTPYDFGKAHIFTIGASNVEVILPPVDETDIFSWIRIIRIGSGRLRISAASTAVIESSSLGGQIWCNEANRKAANITLQLVEEDTWAILAGTGVWKTV